MRIHSANTITQLKSFRKKGYSINALVKKFAIPHTTIWHHVKKVKISKKYINFWRSQQGGSKIRAMQNWKRAQTKAKILLEENLNSREKILLASALYWAEGGKQDFQISNTDPALIKIFLECLKEFNVNQNNLTVSIRIYDGVDPIKARKFWSKVIGIPTESIKYFHIVTGKKIGKHPYGMCRIRVKKPAQLLKEIKSLKNEVLNTLFSPL